MVRGKDNWNLFGQMVKAAAAKQLTAEQFAGEIDTDVKLVRQDYQSYIGKVAKAVAAKAEAKYKELVAAATEAGETVNKTQTEYVTESVEKNLKAYTLKSAKGRKSQSLDIEIELDDFDMGDDE